MLIIFGLSAFQNVPKPGHKRTDSTHSSNESEYTFSSEIAETEDMPLRTEVRFRYLSLQVGCDHAIINREHFHCGADLICP